MEFGFIVSAALNQLCEPLVRALGYDLVEIEVSPKGRTLRIFIDRLDHEMIAVEDCTVVTHVLQDAFERSAIDYDRLEVSSPGVDRVLNRAAHFERYIGSDIALRLNAPVSGRSIFQAQLVALAPERDAIVVDVAGERLTIALDNIKKARLVPVFDWNAVEKSQ